MDTTQAPPRRIHVGIRIACGLVAMLCIHLAMSVGLHHPVQLAMDVLAPASALLLMCAKSYDSPLAKWSLVASLFLWATMLAAPHLFPSPLRW